MEMNVGGTEKLIRIIAGLAILSLLFILEGNARWWGLVGLVPLLTGIIGYCPVNALFGLNTARK
jgi:hypothetical protein